MARLGLTVSAVVKLGQDDRANIILQKLEEEGISADWVLRDPDLSTGSAVMISSHERDAAIFTYRGANTTLRTVELQDGMFDADLVYIAGLSNESADCFPEIVSRARRAGAKVATNPGIRQLTSRAGPFFQSLGGDRHSRHQPGRGRGAPAAPGRALRRGQLTVDGGDSGRFTQAGAIWAEFAGS